MTARENCDVCNGIGRIFFPVTTLKAPITPTEPTSPAGPVGREYPCPECSPAVTPDNVKITTATRAFEKRRLAGAPNPEKILGQLREVAKRDLTMALANYLLSGDEWVEFSEQDDTDTVTFRIRLGVVSKRYTLGLPRDAADLRRKTADLFAEAVRKAVYNWGSKLGYQNMLKSQAYVIFDEAVAHVLKELRDDV
jgi:hypothetical protein